MGNSCNISYCSKISFLKKLKRFIQNFLKIKSVDSFKKNELIIIKVVKDVYCMIF